MVYLGFNMTCCQIVKCWKLVKNGSVYAAPKSRHLWLGTRPGGGSVWGGRPMNREWREGILGTFPVPQQVDVGDTQWVLPTLRTNCSGWRVTLVQCGGQGGQCNEEGELWGGNFGHISGFWSVSRESYGEITLTFKVALGHWVLWGGNTGTGSVWWGRPPVKLTNKYRKKKWLAISSQILCL